MYLSKKLIVKTFRRLQAISEDGDGKLARERTSGLKYFIATVDLLNSRKVNSINLEPKEKTNRNVFIENVGKVIRLNENGLYSNNFNDEFEISIGYKVSNNFLTASLKRNGGYPGRPAPLLYRKNEQLSLHPDYKKNLLRYGEWHRYRLELAIWLLRFDNLDISPNDLKNEDIVDKMLEILDERYGREFRDLLVEKKIELQNFANFQDELLTESPDLSELPVNITELDNSKKEFEQFLKENNKEGSSKQTSYLRAIELLNNILNRKVSQILEGKKSIYKINSTDLIQKLYNYVLIEQKSSNSIFKDEKPKSYWSNGFYSAALRSYLDFLNSKVLNNTKSKTDPIDFQIENFQDDCEFAGLIFSDTLITRFVASLLTKPFVICSGLSGSGKTKLAQAFVMWISESEEQYGIIPVGADWTNREPLLGYPNALNQEDYVVPESGVLNLLLRAKNNFESAAPTKPYFLILDEMNLSHVERYFADFLSAMESGEAIPLHKIEEKEGATLEVPQTLKLPENLFIIGTVNIDETTYMFSPKVLDRANTIEFRVTEENLKTYLKNPPKLDMDLLHPDGVGAGAGMGVDFMVKASDDTTVDYSDKKNDLVNFFNELKKVGAEFGYRTTSEIGRLMQKLESLGMEDGEQLFDIAVMQKMLPKLHGSRNKLTKVLPVLGAMCLKDGEKIKDVYFDPFLKNELSEEELQKDVNVKYKTSFVKISRMYKNAVENGFASYAEA